MQTKLLRTALLAVLSALVLFLAACGGDDSEDSADLGPDPATLTPSDAPVYIEGVVKPTGTMSDDVNSALSKITGQEDPGAMIRSAIDEELSSDPDNGGITYTDDIEPWIGTRAAFFVTEIDAKTDDADGAAVVALDDADGAQSFIDKMSEASDSSETDETYNDVAYKYDSAEDTAVGIDGDFMVIGTKAGFEAPATRSRTTPRRRTRSVRLPTTRSCRCTSTRRRSSTSSRARVRSPLTSSARSRTS